MKFLVNLDLNQNELQNVVIQNLAVDPENPKAGQFWFNTTTKLFKFNDGTALKSLETVEALQATLAEYQDKITASGILKGNGNGGVSGATAGTDYGYPELSGNSAPTTTTVGAVTQHYLDTSTGIEYVCSKVEVVDDNTVYTWSRVTVDISGKQDTIDSQHKLSASLVDGLSDVATSGDYEDLNNIPDIPEAGTDTPQMDGTASAGSATTWSKSDHVHPTDTSRQAKITASGILKGDGDGGVTPATAGTDYQDPITVTENKALVSDSNGKVSASGVTATELGYLTGATSNIQDQLNNIPKYNYLDAVDCSVADGSSQSVINTAAITAIETAYPTVNKWDAVVVEIKFTPSDTFKNGVYYYNGTSWNFLFYVTTGIQLASGTTAGLIQEADSNSDLSLAGGVATVNKASQLRTARTITLSGVTATGQTFDGSGDITIPITAVPANLLTGQVAVANGGTGKSSIGEGKVLVGNSSGGFDEVGTTNQVTENSTDLVTSGGVQAAIANLGDVHKFTDPSPVLTPSGGVATWTVTHNLGSRAVNVQIFETATYNQIMADVTMTNTNSITIKINASDEVAAGTYQVVVIG